jgi:hypothetical protein
MAIPDKPLQKKNFVQLRDADSHDVLAQDARAAK